MRRASRSTACFVMIAVTTVCAGACGSKAGDPESEATSTTVGADEVSIPEFGPFDTGVLRDISIPTHASRESGGPTRIRLDTCEHVAPGRWLLRGAVTAAAETPTPVTLGTVFARGDMGYGTGVRATISGTGPFTLPIDLFARAETKKAGFWAMNADSCSLDLADGNGAYAEVTASRDPIGYRAPAGSVQALGIGARMDTRDSKFEWAYFTWSRRAAQFEALWIPPTPSDDFRISDVDDPDNSETPDQSCLTFHYVVGETSVEQSAGCRRLGGVSEERVPGAETFRWQYNDADRAHPVAVFEGDGFQVAISGDREPVAAVAASLRPLRSTVIDPDALAPPPSFDEVVAVGREHLRATGEFGAIGELTERARVRHDGIMTIAYVGHYTAACSNCEDGVVAFLDVYESNGRWRYDEGSGGSFDDCLSAGGGWTNGVGAQVRLVTGDPSWTIEVLDPQTWAPIHTSDGVWIQDYPAKPSNDYTPSVIVRDAQGKVVPCLQSAAPPG
jgi:hypothetical protein